MIVTNIELNPESIESSLYDLLDMLIRLDGKLEERLADVELTLQELFACLDPDLVRQALLRKVFATQYVLEGGERQGDGD